MEKKTKLKIRARYDQDYDATKYFTKLTGETLTQQQFKEECNVNNILAKYRRTQMLTHINKHQGNFGDFSDVTDYQESLNRLMQAQESFNLLPSELRSKFNNDPAKLIEFVSDKKNKEKAIEYGLIPQPKVQPSKPDKVAPAEGGKDGKGDTE